MRLLLKIIFALSVVFACADNALKFDRLNVVLKTEISARENKMMTFAKQQNQAGRIVGG
jgi:thioredoxin-related protein